MAGGLIQLVVYGAEDMYLTANPQITFFKIVYRRHTNFSIEAFELAMLDNANFGKLSSLRFYRLGDLATKMYLRVTIAGIIPQNGSKFAWVHRLGHALIKSVAVNIGGVDFDKQYGEWIDIWYELTRSLFKERGYNIMIGDVPEMTTYNDKAKPEYTLYIPLRFWFNRFYGLSLPLISIQYHLIYFNFEFEKRENLIVYSKNFNQFNEITFLNIGLVTDYIYLDTVEREKFAITAHEYLIEQTQYAGDEAPIRSKIIEQLYFNFPTKELFWVFKNGYYRSAKHFLAYTDDNTKWRETINQASSTILNEMYIVLKGPVYERDQYGNIVINRRGQRVILEPGTPPPDNGGQWEETPPQSTYTTKNKQFKITNLSEINSFWINPDALRILDYSISGKISALITLSLTSDVTISNFTSTIDIRDVSFPVESMIDTRLSNSQDVVVNQFSNYGVLIDGSYNPVEFTQLDYNDYERFVKRSGLFFNILHPEMHHSATPKDGINVYSFSLKPERHQPMGTSNLSRIEKQFLITWIYDPTFEPGLPPIELINPDSRFHVYALNYNVMRVQNGLTGLAYNG